MRYNLKSIVVKTICLVSILVVAIVVLLLILDVLLMPILKEALLDPGRQDWCGVFSRCLSGMKQSFFEYLLSGRAWRHLDLAAIESRAKRAAILGVLVGLGIMSYSVLSTRK
jgi:hypothetical protein